MRSILLLGLLFSRGATALAGQDSTHLVRGIVRDSAGHPVQGADVFLVATLEGAATDTGGRFAFRTGARGSHELVARKIGFTPGRVSATLPASDPIIIALRAEPVPLEEITVSAGTFIAGEERGAQLTPLEVATTPGTTADIGRTIQTLPGVQTVDEGNALFVRGGDYLETKIFVNDALLLSGFRFDNPTGTFTNTPNAFLLDGIFFSSGGFGARFGNALSGVVSLRTLGRPIRNGGTIAVGLGALSGSGALTLSPTVGARATFTRFFTRPIFWVNGSSHSYSPAPNGSDASVSVAWNYRPSGEIKLFALDQQNRLGVEQSFPDTSLLYRTRTRNAVAVLSWHDSFGRFSETASLAFGARRQKEALDPYFTLDVDTDLYHLFTYAGYDAGPRLALRAGGELERLASRFAGAKGTFDIKSRATDDRLAAFIEADWRVGERIQVTPGLRSDRATLTSRRSFDPRLAAAWLLGHDVTVTFAAGIYHQVPEPLFLDSILGQPNLPPMRSTQVVGGFQLGAGERIARVEVYAKRYRDLVQADRENVVVAGGKGQAEGADFFLKGSGPWKLTGRLSYSFIHARRTDPNTGVMARAPADVTHALSLIVERALAPALNAGVAVHYSTGRPYTRVVSASFDPDQNRYLPTYGPPMGERVPAFVRVDVNLSRLISLGPRWLLVTYASVNNLLNRRNVYQYTYSRDYSEQIPISSLFQRSFYFGATLTSR